MDARVEKLFFVEQSPLEAARAPLLRWLIFGGANVFAAALLWHYGLIERMLESDRTHISTLIALLYIGATLHCLWRTILIAHESDAAQRTAAIIAQNGVEATSNNTSAEHAVILPSGLITAHVSSLTRKANLQRGLRVDQTLLLRALAVQLRGSNNFGSFASDTLMKLGLLGTIVGFIMMLAPIAGLDTDNRTALRSSMTLMSDGMAVAMYTTLAGLVGSILIKIQYYMLEEATARLFNFAIRFTEVYVVSVLDRQTDGRQ